MRPFFFSRFPFSHRKCNTAMIIVLRLFRMNIYSNDDGNVFSCRCCCCYCCYCCHQKNCRSFFFSVGVLWFLTHSQPLCTIPVDVKRESSLLAGYWSRGKNVVGRCRHQTKCYMKGFNRKPEKEIEEYSIIKRKLGGFS